MRRVALLAALVIAGQAHALTQNQRGVILSAYARDPDAETYFAQLIRCGYSPTLSFKRAVTTYITSEKGAGNWGGQDYTYLTMISACVAGTNMAQPALYTVTWYGTCSYAAGLSGDGTTCYGDTVVLMNALTSPRLTSTNAGIDAFSAGQGGFEIGSTGSTSTFSLSVTANDSIQISSNTAIVDTGSGGGGQHFAWRVNGTNATTGLNGAVVSNNVSNTSTALPAVAVTIGRKNTGFIASGTNLYLMDIGKPFANVPAHYANGLNLIRAIGESRI